MKYLSNFIFVLVFLLCNLTSAFRGIYTVEDEMSRFSCYDVSLDIYNSLLSAINLKLYDYERTRLRRAFDGGRCIRTRKGVRHQPRYAHIAMGTRYILNNLIMIEL